jgi:hypothetical protein
MGSPDSSVDIVLGYRLEGREDWFRFHAGARKLYVLHSVQTRSRAKPTSPIHCVPRLLFAGLKRSERETDYSLQFSLEAANE